MRRAIFIFLGLLGTACSSSTSTSGTQGHADFSFGSSTPANIPIAAGSDVTLKVVLHDKADPTFQSTAADVLSVVSASRTADLTWYVALHAQNEGKSRISVTAGTNAIDSIDLEVASIAKLEIPASAELRVGTIVAVDVTARGASGQELYAPSAIRWSVDHPEIVLFWNALQNATEPSATGTSLAIRGVGVGSAKVNGTYGKTAVNVPVTVK